MTDEDLIFAQLEELPEEERLQLLTALNLLGERQVADLLRQAQASGRRLIFEEPADLGPDETDRLEWRFE